MRIVGIDPGLDGALASIGTHAPEDTADDSGTVRIIRSEINVHDTPTADVGSGKKTKRVYLATVMAELMRAAAPDLVIIEAQQAFSPPGRKVGASSMFSLGFGYGMWQGIAAALGYPIQLVHPRKWKDAMMDGMGKEKDAARVQALRLFPTCAAQLDQKKDHGRAEALLIAEYGRRTYDRETV